MKYLDKYRLFESKRSDALLKKFLDLFERRESNKVFKSINTDLPIEIKREFEILYFLYTHHTDLYYWGMNFEQEDRNLTKNTVKKYVTNLLAKKWEDNYELYKQIENSKGIDDPRWYDSNQRMHNIHMVISTTLRKNVPVKYKKASEFNL